MASDILLLDELSGSELEKTNKVNLIFQQIEDGVFEGATVAMADGDASLPEASFTRASLYTVTSSPFTADRSLTIPARPRFFFIKNDDTSVFRLGVLPLAGNTTWLRAGEIALLYSDGSDIWKLPGPSDWIAPALTGNWANTGGAWDNFGVRRDSGSELLHLRGVVQNAVDTFPTGATIITLPANWRPAADKLFVVPELSAAGALAEVKVTAAGVVSVTAVTTGWASGISLDGIMLR